ncbi:hypothetical protein BAUCODRAFT_23284 [Baudoinia panamericana UAMH 10762]|uniref:Uncharacterized protein n=1 Tax=Baudoinia panamericana (strain UAMH 10762) TaxID=717646 RepID=M2LVA0_BAUPA|nr:uncharacterized protein BAUCODRAFT_23284 [Baudoinia panamericana UAMH 10762]EMC98537.1 hypothetical protein BAUCODRAFT_23284 [Baudoinia panamericana UAMH 10762]
MDACAATHYLFYYDPTALLRAVLVMECRLRRNSWPDEEESWSSYDYVQDDWEYKARNTGRSEQNAVRESPLHQEPLVEHEQEWRIAYDPSTAVQEALAELQMPSSACKRSANEADQAQQPSRETHCSAVLWPSQRNSVRDWHTEVAYASCQCAYSGYVVAILEQFMCGVVSLEDAKGKWKPPNHCLNKPASCQKRPRFAAAVNRRQLSGGSAGCIVRDQMSQFGRSGCVRRQPVCQCLQRDAVAAPGGTCCFMIDS